MQEQAFKLRSLEDVRKFERLLTEFCESQAGYSISSYLPLERIFLLLSGDSNGGRIFTALLDIKINLMMLFLDSNESGATSNRLGAYGKLEGDILDDPAQFLGRLKIHRHDSSFVLRYRALADKIMGLIVLFNSPDSYDKFAADKSKKKYFSKFCKTNKIIPEELLDKLLGILQKFDNEFRTPEAHGTGSLRKHTLLLPKPESPKEFELMGYWNVLLYIINTITEAINSSYERESSKNPPTIQT